MFGEYLNAAQGAEFLPKAMAFAVVPAICEEFVFRAILLTEYNEGGFGAGASVRAGSSRAVGCSSGAGAPPVAR